MTIIYIYIIYIYLYKMTSALADIVIDDDDEMTILGDLNYPYANHLVLPEHHEEDADFGLIVDDDNDSAFDEGSFKSRTTSGNGSLTFQQSDDNEVSNEVVRPRLEGVNLVCQSIKHQNDKVY